MLNGFPSAAQSTHIGFQVRSQSPLFCDFPWYTDVLKTTGDLSSLQIPGLETLTQRLSAYERHLFSFSNSSLEVTDTHRLLGIELGLQNNAVIAKPSSHPSTPPPKYSLAQGERMVHLLTPYKLLDVVCSRLPGFHARKGALVTSRGALDPKVHKLAVAQTLQNWTSVLKTFHNAYIPTDGGNLGESEEQEDLRSGVSPSLPLPNPSSLLITQLAVNRKNNIINTMESNVMLCALVISYLLKDASGVGIPGLPTDSTTFANVVGDSRLEEGQLVPSTDTRTLIQICEESRPASSKPSDHSLWHIMVPIACALFLSPLSIFCSRSLTSISFQRRALITSCMSLGNEKPPVIRACENSVWDIVLDVVFGRLHPSLIIATLHQKLPWTDIFQVDAMESIGSWFVERRLLDAAQPPSELSPSAPDHFQQQNSFFSSQFGSGELSTTPVPSSTYNAQISEKPEHNPPSAPQVSDNDTLSIDQPAGFLPAISDPLRKSGRIAELATKGLQDPTDVDDVNDNSGGRSGSGSGRSGDGSRGSGGGSGRGARNKPSVRRKALSFDDDVDIGGAANNPVDVDAFVASRDPVLTTPDFFRRKEERTLDLDHNAPCVPVRSDEQMLGYDIEGGEHDLTMPAHFKDYHTRLHAIHQKAKLFYKDGKPRHVSAPESSVFLRMSFEEFSTKSPPELAEILNNRCIVVTDWGQKRTGFDANNLRDIVSLFRPISVQGQDYSLRAGGYKAPTSIPEIVQGTMQQVLDNATLGENGQVLNALDLPRPQGISAPPVLSSDYVSWEAMTEAFGGIYNFMVYPIGDVSWYLTGLRGALTFFHLDSDGFCTGVNVEYGKKLWGVMIPKSPLGHYNTFSLTKDTFSLDEISEESNDFDIELVVLRPQDGIIMGPNTLHMAGTLEHAICRGFHFYSPTLLLRTAAGLINAFILNDFISNTHHNASRAILLRMLGFHFDAHISRRFQIDEHCQNHLVDISSWEGVAALLTLCTLAILVNVLDFRTYLGPNQVEGEHPTEHQLYDLQEYDSNNIIWPERMAMSHGRGMALAMLKAITDCCTITNVSNGSVEQNLPLRHLARQMVAIVEFKRNAQAAKLDGAPHCRLSSLIRQIKNVATWNSDLADLYNHPNDINLDLSVTSFTGQEGYQVQWTVDPHDWFEDKAFDFLSDGYTPLDCKFFDPLRRRNVDDTERPRKRAKTSH
ncbi:hypothetical protein BJ165DRAFT_1521354 [Panaeolus papilionaceus]|nr:hypothetical protein BJ165DRAFT_1521354 [Panaeolus papilionaceus]